MFEEEIIAFIADNKKLSKSVNSERRMTTVRKTRGLSKTDATNF
jgi:hypothetical protein